MAYQTPLGTQTKTGHRPADGSWLQWRTLRGKLFVSMGSRFMPLIAFAVILMATLACSVQRTPSSLDSQHRGADVPHLADPESSLDDDSASGADDAGPRNPEANATQRYDLDHPNHKWSLPSSLKEISDISLLSDSEVVCVEDERGIVYVYNLETSQVTDTVRFAAKGDYEGLAMVNSTVFVLRSDGRLFELSSLKRHPSVRTYDLRLPITESEGLCFDPVHNRLLVAPKSRNQGGFGKDIRPIFAFTLPQRVVSTSPVLEISLHDIRRFAKHHGLPLPRRLDREKNRMHAALRFEPSAIAVHPISGDIFILSSVDHLLVSCTSSGTITGYTLLDAGLFRQPEGLAFFPSGDLLISNEAAGKEATLLLFRSKHQRK